MSDDITTRVRIVLLVLLSTATLFPAWYQPFLDYLWRVLRNNAVYKLSTFETLWTVICYAVIEPWVTTIFIKHPEYRFSAKHRSDSTPRRPRGMRRPSRRIVEGLTYIAPLLVLDLTMIKKFADVPLEAMLQSGNYDPRMALNSTQCRGNTCQSHFLMPSVHNFTMASPAQTQRALPDLPPTSRRLAFELILSLVIYDASFFAFHLVMHYVPVLRSWHAPHHSHAEIHPQITNQLHIFERLGLVLLANFSLNIIKCHVLTRTLFVPVFVWLLVEIHCGMDLPWGYDKILPEGWGGGARKHAKHHAGGDGGLEPYFEWCDTAVIMLRRSWNRQCTRT